MFSMQRVLAYGLCRFSSAVKLESFTQSGYKLFCSLSFVQGGFLVFDNTVGGIH